MDQERLKALFLLSGIELYSMVPIPNEYGKTSGLWNGPWWVCQTRCGMITVGWRKWVINIEWTLFDVPEDEPLTRDNVTKGPNMIHAYSYGDAVTYMSALKKAFARAQRLNLLKTELD